MRAGVVWAVGAAAMAAAVALAASGWGEEPGALTNWQALVLGLVQGATELLPISSSGHLILVPWLADWEFLQENDEFNQTFDVALHLGTLVAVAIYFRREIVAFTVGWIRTLRTRRIETSDERVAWIVLVATIPAVVAGGLGESWIAEHLGEPWQIAILLALFAGVLWLADRRPQDRKMDGLGLGQALAIGVAQSLALAPGVSRSGVTITAGRALRLDRDAAARLSFLLLIPTVFGAVVYKGVTDVVLGDLPPGWQGPFLVGTLAAAVSGLAAIWALLGYVRRHDYTVFVVYRLVAAALVVLLIVAGARGAGF
ncbi:MAG TPA: undecaprenyl-diphosphatase UppP [Gaiellaceae bacterium]|nr:undecaprenyl-diphosphatase UppP [Gaiellaceae bacterium]